MELWAVGFNAFSQLTFNDDPITRLPHDLSEFRCILKDELIKIVRTSYSATIVKISSNVGDSETKLRIAGMPDDFTAYCLKNNKVESKTIAIAGNEKISEFRDGSIWQYNSLLEHKEQIFSDLWETSEQGHSGFRDHLEEIVANETCFTGRSASKIFTWGDGRYEHCLGRELQNVKDKQSCNDEVGPVSAPYQVKDLLDLDPMNIYCPLKVSSGGYATAVLLDNNDVYFWGQGQPRELLTEVPTPLDLNGKDFIDVSVGFNHIIVLTTEHEAYIVGDGNHGQLGFGSAVKVLEEWEKIKLPLAEGQRIIGIHAGHKNTFLVVENSASEMAEG